MKPHQVFLDRLLSDPAFIARWGEASPEIAEALASAIYAQAEISTRMIEECNRAVGYAQNLDVEELMTWAVTAADVSPEQVQKMQQALRSATDEPGDAGPPSAQKATDFQDGTEPHPYTHAVVPPDDRRYKWCRCGSCNYLARCTPTSDFYGQHGEPLKCERCLIKPVINAARTKTTPGPGQALFQYKALNREGEKVFGVIAATSKNDAIGELRLRGLRPQSISLV